MKRKLYKLLVIVLSVCNLQKSLNLYFNMLSLVLSSVLISILLYREYKNSGKLSIIYIVGINFIVMTDFLRSSGLLFNFYLLFTRAIVYLALIALGIIIVWIARTFKKNFIKYLLLSLFMIIFNFGGLYGTLYSLYSPYGQESFEIDQKMSYSQAIMPLDFIYYSSDVFFGTNISDVKIKYIDYLDGYNEESIVSKHIDKYEGASLIIQITKMLSLFESVLFIVYISIIVMSSRGEKEVVSGKVRYRVFCD